MHTLARVILAVVAVFVIVVTATLVIKSRSARVESLGPSPASADLQIKQVDLEEEAQGVRWRLKADQALMYDEAGVTKLQKVNANVYQRSEEHTSELQSPCN